MRIAIPVRLAGELSTADGTVTIETGEVVRLELEPEMAVKVTTDDGREIRADLRELLGCTLALELLEQP